MHTKSFSPSLVDYSDRPHSDRTRSNLLFFWNGVVLLGVLYFIVGGIWSHFEWILPQVYESLKLGIIVFTILAGITVYTVAALPYRLFYVFCLMQYAFAGFWTYAGGLFRSEIPLKGYWYVPLILFVSSGIVGIVIFSQWRSECKVSETTTG